MLTIPIPKPGRRLQFEFEVTSPEALSQLQGVITLMFGDVPVPVQCLEVKSLRGNLVEVTGEVVERLN